MEEALSALKDTPIPTILVVAGIFFVLLSVATQLSGKISVEPTQRRAALLAGGLLIAIGVGLYLGGNLRSASDGKTSEGSLTYEPDTNRYGDDYKSIDLTNPDPYVCQHACQEDSKCQAYTYVPPGIQGSNAKCWLKNLQPAITSARGLVSGIRTH
jgi:hypothetical protein